VARQIQNRSSALLRLGQANLKKLRMPVEIYRLCCLGAQTPSGAERLAFSVRQRQMRRTLIGAVAC